MKRAHHRSDPVALAKLLLCLILVVVAAPAITGQETTSAAPSPADEPHPAPAPLHTRPHSKPLTQPVAGAQAIAFAKRLREVIEHELSVQKYELDSLGAVPIASLGGQRLEFRMRVDRDAEEFEARLAAVPKTPIQLPRLSQARRKLAPREKLLIGRLIRAYGQDRNQSELDFLYNTNEKFLATENWGAREGVMHTRDTLLAREITYGDLAAQGRKILVTEPSAAELDDMEAQLDAISPETRTSESSVVQQLLGNPELQAQVLGELMGVLTARYDPQVPTESDEELLLALTSLQSELLEAAGLTEAQQELEAIDAELVEVDAQLADMGVSALTIDQRRTTAKRKTKLMVARNALQSSWNRTAPPEPQASLLITTQDALIRRRLHDLGTRGALFAHRYDTLEPTAMLSVELRPSAPEVWEFFDAQAKLITSLDEARPAPNPLAGMTFGIVPAVGPTLPQDLQGNLPKPKKANTKKKKGPKKGKKKGGGR